MPPKTPAPPAAALAVETVAGAPVVPEGGGRTREDEGEGWKWEEEGWRRKEDQSRQINAHKKINAQKNKCTHQSRQINAHKKINAHINHDK
jgi:hypothetical protein